MFRLHAAPNGAEKDDVPASYKYIAPPERSQFFRA